MKITVRNQKEESTNKYNIKIAIPYTSGKIRSFAKLQLNIKKALSDLGYLVISEIDVRNKIADSKLSNKSADNSRFSETTVNKILSDALDNSQPTAVIIQRSLLSTTNQCIGVVYPETTLHPRIQPYCKKIINLNTTNLKGAIIKFLQDNRREAVLFKEGTIYVKTGKWVVEKENDPTIPLPRNSYPLILKDDVIIEVEKALTREHLHQEIDPVDLKYQTLFRLTACPLDTLRCSSERLPQIKMIIDEQINIAINRNRLCHLPLSKILSPSNILPSASKLYRGLGDSDYIARDADGNQKRVYFRSVNTEIAHQYFTHLHYIHTPRTNQAWGFFAENDDLPFSLLSTDLVDRNYKQVALRMFGYNPTNCIEYTRLYSCPGAPRNSSSALFSKVNKEIRKQRPYLEAAISSLMPAYSDGASMLTGGFIHSIIKKPLKHSFIKTIYGYEYVTKRRADTQQPRTTLSNSWELEPVHELISVFRKPPFYHILNVGEHTININHE